MDCRVNLGLHFMTLICISPLPLLQYPQHTTEWAIPYENAEACLRDLRCWLAAEHEDPHGLRPHFPIEIRFSASDEIFLSPSNGHRTCWLGIVQYKCARFLFLHFLEYAKLGSRPYGFNVPYRKLFDGYERIVSRHGGRPHWAKAHRLSPNILRKLYPAFDDFTRVLENVDPFGMFRNEYVQRHIMGRPIDVRIFKRRQL